MKVQVNRMTPVLLVGLAMLSMTAIAAEDGEGEQTKGFWIESETVDVGEVKSGSAAVATFILHNDTDKEVKIIRAKPS